MPNNKKGPGMASGILRKIRNVFGLNIGTVMFGVLFSLYAVQCHIISDLSPN